MTLIIAGMRCWAGRGRGYRWRAVRGSRGKASAGGPEGGAPRRSRNGLKMFHKQILSQNEA